MNSKNIVFGLFLICLASGAYGKSESATVWIKKNDGSTSCGGEKEGVALEEGAEALRKKGIQVLNSRKAQDGKMRIQVCDIPTGKENAYEISRKDLKKALDLNQGFQLAE